MLGHLIFLQMFNLFLWKNKRSVSEAETKLVWTLMHACIHGCESGVSMEIGGHGVEFSEKRPNKKFIKYGRLLEFCIRLELCLMLQLASFTSSSN